MNLTADRSTDTGAATHDETMLRLQTAMGFLGVVGGLVELTADLAPALQAEYGGTFDTILAGLSITFSSIPTLVMAVPDVTGTSWYAAKGLWAGNFGVASAYCATSIGALLVKLTGRSGSAVLKNVGDMMLGPIVATISGGAMMAFIGRAYTREPSDSYTMAMTCIAPIPACIQVARFGIKKGSLESYVRAGIVAFLDLLANEASWIMLIVASMDPPPSIRDQTLQNGKAGASYTYQLQAWRGSDAPYGAVANWKLVADTKLPSGLALDAATGKITGIPSQAGKTKFQVVCSDSYGPKRWSKPRELELTINT